MAKEKTLSICIPTCNRAGALGRLLGSIAREAEGCGKEIEICVSDNFSSDNTQEVLEKWERKLPLKRSRAGRRLPFDLNLVRAARMASGKYVWLMGDDDELADGAVRRAVNDAKLAEKEGAGAIYFNAICAGGNRANVSFREFRVFGRGSPDAPGLNASFIGSICISRKRMLSVLGKTEITGGMLRRKGEKREILFGFAHTYLFLECVAASGSFGIEPLPGIRMETDGGKKSYEKLMLFGSLLATEYLEARRLYPWFRSAPGDLPVRGHFARMAMAAERPELEYAYEFTRDATLETLRLEGRGNERRCLLLLEKVRRTLPAKLALIALFRLSIPCLGIGVSPSAPCEKGVARMLGFSVERGRRFLEA